MSATSDNMTGWRRTKVPALIAVMLALLLPVAGPVVRSTDIDHFSEGATHADIVLSAPGFNATVHIPVPNPSIPVSGALNVSTVPDAAPLAPRIDMGADGSVDWEFNASFGPFGNQSLFADGRPNLTLQVGGLSDVLSKTFIPVGADVVSAALNVTCFPKAPQTAEYSLRNSIIPASGLLYGNITGIPKNATAINGSVRLEGGKKTIVDPRQENAADMRIVGNMTTRQSLAQTFMPMVDGELLEVQFYINNITDSPGTLSVEIRTADVLGTPTSTRISTTMTAPQNSVYAGNWNVASFNGVQLQAQERYAIVVFARNAMSGRDSYYGFGCNFSDNYPVGALWAYPGSANASGQPVEIFGADMCFRAVIRTNATVAEMGMLTVNGARVDGPGGDGAYWSNFTDPVYAGGNWPLVFGNPNDFDILYLNWSGVTWYERHIENLTFDVGNDGTVDAAIEGDLGSAKTIVLPPGALDAALEAASGSEPDRYGISIGTVEVAIFARGYGTLEADALGIGYELSLKVADFKTTLAGALASKPAGTVDVPVAVNASSAGSLRLTSLAVVVDSPPSLIAPVLGLSLPEDGSDMRLLDIGAYIRDDFNPVLVYAVLTNSNATKVFLGFNGTFLTARTMAANWSGSTQVVLEATDSRGQKALTNEFTITVEPKDDAPVIVSVPPAQAELGRNFTYRPSVVDAENDTLSFKLDTRPDGMAVDAEGTLAWVPVRDQLNRTFDVAVNVSDGSLWTVQRFPVSVVCSNHRPVLQAPVPLNESAWTGKAYLCQFRAQDLDAGDRLTFSLSAGPQGMAIDASSGLIGWASPVSGDHTIGVDVTDGIDTDHFQYALHAGTNGLPAFISKPVKKATVGQSYIYQPVASDADNGSYLSFSLVQRPEGMTLQPGGQLIWTPSAAQKGTAHVEIAVTDGIDLATQSFDIRVSAAETVAGDGNGLPTLLVVAGIACAVAAVGAGWFLGRRKGR
jgi:hypothetical protein